MVELVKIKQEEVLDLSKFAKETFYRTFVGTCTEEDMESFLEENYNTTILASELADTNNHYYFAKENNTILGYVLFKENKLPYEAKEMDKVLELQRIYVAEQAQGKGVGRQLLELVFQHAEQNKCDCIFLGVWEHNQKAQKFYRSFGFENAGHIHDFPIGNTPQTDVWMQKVLKQ